MKTREEIVADLLRGQLAGAEDNLYRFRMAARGKDTSQQYGESGRTLADFLTDAEARVAELKAVMAPSELKPRKAWGAF